jgi:hypothetical protein
VNEASHRPEAAPSGLGYARLGEVIMASGPGRCTAGCPFFFALIGVAPWKPSLRSPHNRRMGDIELAVEVCRRTWVLEGIGEPTACGISVEHANDRVGQLLDVGVVLPHTWREGGRSCEQLAGVEASGMFGKGALERPAQRRA